MAPAAQRRETFNVENLAKDARIMLYKGAIRRTAHLLQKMKLTDAERVALRFLDFNPNMLLIVSDCGAMITRKMQSSEMFRNLFYMYRHVYMTVIFDFQDDTSLEAPLRKQSSVTGFTTQQCASAYFNRSANSFSPEMKIEANRAIQQIFGHDTQYEQFTKLIYIRDDDYPLRYYLAEEHMGFKFGGAGLWAFAEKTDQKRKARRAITSNFGVYGKAA
jgi:hypothetical protein